MPNSKFLDELEADEKGLILGFVIGYFEAEMQGILGHISILL